MSKPKHRDRGKNKKPPSITPPPPPVVPPTEKRKPNWKRRWAFLVGIGVVLTILNNISNITAKLFPKSDFETGELHSDAIMPPSSGMGFAAPEFTPIFTNVAQPTNEPKIEGIILDSVSLRPSPIPDDPFGYPSGVWFTFGGYSKHATIANLNAGIEADFPLNEIEDTSLLHGNAAKHNPKCGVSSLRFAAWHNRLYVACKLYDFEKKNYIGEIEYNHWKVYIPNRLVCWSNSKRLEIRDLQGKIVIALSYEHLKNVAIPSLSVGGYFVNNRSVIVVPNYETKRRPIDCFCFPFDSTGWKEDAADAIDSLKSVFPEKTFSTPD